MFLEVSRDAVVGFGANVGVRRERFKRTTRQQNLTEASCKFVGTRTTNKESGRSWGMCEKASVDSKEAALVIQQGKKVLNG